MGMFNWVDFSGVCPKCHHPLGQFQTKDGDLVLVTVSYLSVFEFHNFCDNCRTLITYQRKCPPAESIDDFELVME